MQKIHWVNKLLPVAGISEDKISAADRLFEKWIVERETKFQGQLWKFEDNLSAN